MKRVTCQLKSISAYSQSRKHDTPKENKEGADEYERRTWREKCTTDPEGTVVIPAMALKFALADAAQMMGRKVPGRGATTYTKFFVSGVLCSGDCPLGVRKEDVDCVAINAHAQGRRTDGARVTRMFPIVHAWETTAEFMIFDDTITKPVFAEAIHTAGMMIGIGRFRPQNGGINGRFEATITGWETVK